MTLVAVFYNEEKRLPGYFKNIKGMFDEMLIVDCSSTDRTAQICRDNGATVFPSKVRYLENNIGMLLEKVKTEWVFILSGDERLPEELKQEIAAETEKGDSDVYFIQRIDYLFDGFARIGRVDAPSARLFRRGHLTFPVEPHSTPVPTGKQKRLKNVFLHYSFETAGAHIKKVTTYVWDTPEVYRTVGKTSRVHIGDRNKYVKFFFGAHGWRRLFLFPPMHILNYLFRHKFIFEGIDGIIYSTTMGIEVFLEEAIYFDEKRREKKGIHLDWSKEYPDR